MTYSFISSLSQTVKNSLVCHFLKAVLSYFFIIECLRIRVKDKSTICIPMFLMKQLPIWYISFWSIFTFHMCYLNYFLCSCLSFMLLIMKAEIGVRYFEDGMGHEPRMWAAFRSWKRQGERLFPWNLQKECRSANTLILVCKTHFGLPTSRIVR